MGVFSSRLAPNEASPGLEVYIHTLLNGQILPRCCLHSCPPPTSPPPPKPKILFTAHEFRVVEKEIGEGNSVLGMYEPGCIGINLEHVSQNM